LLKITLNEIIDRTPLDYGSTRRRGIYLYNTQHSE